MARCSHAPPTPTPPLISQARPVPVIVVGGGAALAGDALPGASVVVRPEHAAVANAVGAALSQVAFACQIPLKHLHTHARFLGLTTAAPNSGASIVNRRPCRSLPQSGVWHLRWHSAARRRR